MQMTGHGMTPMDLCLNWDNHSQKGFVFHICQGKWREFQHVVGRDNYTVTITDTKAQPQPVTKVVNLDLYGRPNDFKFGNGAYDPAKTKCELRKPYKNPKFDAINK